MSVVEVPLKKRMLLPWSFDHEVALSSSQSVGPLPQARAARRGAARGTSKPTDKAPSCGCCEWMRVANVSWTLQNVPMRYASIRSDHVKVAEQSRHYAERRCCCKSGQRAPTYFRIVFLAVTHIAVTNATECLPTLALFALVNSGPTGC
jgi:hypothetical protein